MDPDEFARLPTRHRVLLLLVCPSSPRAIRDRIPGASRNRIETVFRRMRSDRLIVPITKAHQSRLYKRTFLGELLAQELDSDLPTCPHTLSPDELERRSWVARGRYRRLVLCALGTPMTARQARKVILRHFTRIGMNHVHRTLRAMRGQGIAERCEQGWRLTAVGMRLRTVELHGLDQDWAPREGWVRLTRTARRPSGGPSGPADDGAPAAPRLPAARLPERS